MLAELPTRRIEHKVLPLFCRVRPIPGESLLSLIARTAEENVHVRIAALINHAGIDALKPAFVPFAHVDRAASLAKLLSVDHHEVEDRMHPRIGDANSRYVDWFGTPLERRFIKAQTRRISPAGLRASAHHRAFWMIKPLTFCAESFERLTDQCPQCGSRLGWTKTKGVEVCEHCDGSLLDHGAGEIVPEQRGVAGDAAALVSTSSNVRNAGLAKLPPPFAAWQAGHVFAAIVDLGVVATNVSGSTEPPMSQMTANGDFSFFDIDHLLAGYQIVSGWPDSLVALTDKVTGIRRHERHHFRELLGPLGRYFDQGASDTPLGTLLQAELPEVLRELGLPLRVVSNSRLLGAKRRSKISVTEAVQKFGIDARTLRRLEGQGRSFVCGHVTLHGPKLYDEEMLAVSVRALREAASESEVVKELGIPAYVLPAFVKVGLINYVSDHDAQLMAGNLGIFERSSLDELLRKLDGLARARGSEGISISGALERHLDPMAWAETFGAILQGRIRVIGVDSDSRPCANRMRVRSDEMRMFLAGLTLDDLPEGVSVSCLTASSLLGVNSIFVAAAARAGLLTATYAHPKFDIPIKALAAFIESYLIFNEASRWFEGPAQRFRRQLENRGTKPVAVLAGIPVWQRQDVEAAFPSSA